MRDGLLRAKDKRSIKSEHKLVRLGWKRYMKRKRKLAAQKESRKRNRDE